MASRKLTIVVDAPDSPSTEIDGTPAWRAQLWDGNKTNGARPDKAKAVEAISIDGPAGAASFAINIRRGRDGAADQG